LVGLRLGLGLGFDRAPLVHRLVVRARLAAEECLQPARARLLAWLGLGARTRG